MTYSEAKAYRDQLEAELNRLSAILNSFPHDGPMGLTPDHVKLSPEYRAAKSAWDLQFHKLRTFNGAFTREFRAELKLERDAKYGRTA